MNIAYEISRLLRKADDGEMHHSKLDAELLVDFNVNSLALAIDRVRRILHRSCEPFPLLRLMKGGQFLPAQDFTLEICDGAGRTHAELGTNLIATALSNGWTLSVNQIERFMPQMSDLLREIQADFSYPIQANAYLSTTSQPGFRPHFDKHDLVVMQGGGSKNWTHEKTRRNEFTLPPDEGRLSERTTVHAGDLYLIPKGLWHSVSGNGDLSLHYTIGLHKDHEYRKILDEIPFSDAIQRILR